MLNYSFEGLSVEAAQCFSERVCRKLPRGFSTCSGQCNSPADMLVQDTLPHQHVRRTEIFTRHTGIDFGVPSVVTCKS